VTRSPLSRWRLRTDATGEGAARKHLLWVREKLERETSQESLEPRHDGGFVISFACQLTANSWPEAVYETIDLAQRTGDGWTISGAISEEVDMFCTKANVPGIRTMQVMTERVFS
jgi:hypothetical protein